MLTQNLNMLWASLMVEELIRNGVDTFVISTGSRSTPLVVAAAENPKAKTIVHFDERGAAYFALGYAKTNQKPACVISTSGSAVANFLPAVVEAAHDHTPLIILSADRPPELRDTSANQTIDQTKIFGSFVRWFFDMPCPDQHIEPHVVLSTIDYALWRATALSPGPVHINTMYREPLDLLPNKDFDEAYLSKIASWHLLDTPWTTYHHPVIQSTAQDTQELLHHIQSAKNGIVVLGRMTSSEAKSAAELTKRLGWPVYVDTVSEASAIVPHNLVIHHLEHIINNSENLENLHADLILHFGGSLISKSVSKFFQNQNAEKYIHITDTPERSDPSHCVTHRIMSKIHPILDALKNLSSFSPSPSHLLFPLKSLSDSIHASIEHTMIHEQELHEPLISYLVSKNIQKNTGLFISNSMPIRDFNMFGKYSSASISITTNRGASGIDGNLATAIGFAYRTQLPTIAILGDLAFLHDLNSLMLLESIKSPFLMIILNNNGSDIFSYLPIAAWDKEKFESFFATPHNRTMESVSQLGRVSYQKPASPEDLENILKTFMDSAKPVLAEIILDRSKTPSIRQRLNSTIFSQLST